MLLHLACAIDVRPYAACTVADAHPNTMDIACARTAQKKEVLRTNQSRHNQTTRLVIECIDKAI